MHGGMFDACCSSYSSCRASTDEGTTPAMASSMDKPQQAADMPIANLFYDLGKDKVYGGGVRGPHCFPAHLRAIVLSLFKHPFKVLVVNEFIDDGTCVARTLCMATGRGNRVLRREGLRKEAT
nr:unnamed protein product [Digitaria exilis]